MNDKHKKILEILEVHDDTSNNELEIISESLKGKIRELKSLGLDIRKEREGVRIPLDSQPVNIYKTKKDALIHCTEQSFSKDILIMENSKAWAINDRNQRDVFIENIKIWFEYKKILVDKIADYVSKIDKEFILLSADKGKIDIGFSEKPIKYFNNEFKQEDFKAIEKLINKNSDFISFFKDSFIGICSKELKKNRFSYAIANIESLYEEALRNYNLFKNKFSFEEFNKGFEQEEEKYLKNYQLFLSDFLGKIANFPIQIGVYLFLIHRFSELIPALLVIVALIVVWGIYTIKILFIMRDNIKEIKKNFDASILLIKNGSGLTDSGFDESKISETKRQITDKFDRLLDLLNTYISINIVSSLLFIVITLHYLWQGFIS